VDKFAVPESLKT